jgi:hypothetical protein
LPTFFSFTCPPSPPLLAHLLLLYLPTFSSFTCSPSSPLLAHLLLLYLLTFFSFTCPPSPPLLAHLLLLYLLTFSSFTCPPSPTLFAHLLLLWLSYNPFLYHLLFKFSDLLFLLLPHLLHLSYLLLLPIFIFILPCPPPSQYGPLASCTFAQFMIYMRGCSEASSHN